MAWRLGGSDYALLSPGREGKGQWLFSTRKGRLILLSVCMVLLLFVGAWMHPDTAAAIHKVTGNEDKPDKADNPPVDAPGGHPGSVAGKGPDKEKAVERPDYQPAVNAVEKDKFAYLVWLSNTPDKDNENFDADNYFVACRVLLWQLLHDPKTKAASDIDVIVMAGPQVGEAHKERLRQDGAIVRDVTVPHGKDDSWIIPKESRWGDIMGKLRAWEFEEYSRILMLDGDMILQSPLDDIFHDPDAVVMRTKTAGRKDDEPELPEDYLLCSFMEISGTDHEWPPSDKGRFPGYFNGGFFMLKPNKKIFNYFVGLLDIPHRFNPEFMEQNLLNYAHRWDGAMPWKEINGKWNTKFTSEKDMNGGVVSMHEKWWKLRSGGKKLMQFVLSKRWQAEGYWLAQRDAAQEERV